MRPQTNQGAEARIMTLQEAAEYLHISYSTAYRLAVSGELDAFRVRNSWHQLAGLRAVRAPPAGRADPFPLQPWRVANV